jgi:hypothetical protein
LTILVVTYSWFKTIQIAAVFPIHFAAIDVEPVFADETLYLYQLLSNEGLNEQ